MQGMANFKSKKTAAAWRGFLAAARLSCKTRPVVLSMTTEI